ncbi:MAG: radical SAM protein [Deltaproteobacteria bacterium]|nr:radical SAM protein [Deltaproteobacteria bacterium]
MKNKNVIIIAMDQPLDSDAHLKGKMANAERRAARQSSRFPDLDLPGIQKEVHRNLSNLALQLGGRSMGLLDLMNYLKNGRRFPHLTRSKAADYYLFANGFTLNGVYLYQHLKKAGYDPRVVQNYSLVRLPDILKEKPLAVCISSTFLYLDDIKKMAAEIKAVDPAIPVIVGGILVKKVLDAGENLAPQTRKWLAGFHGKVDAFVVETHGEQSLVTLLNTLLEEKDPGLCPNLALFDEKGRMFFTPRKQEDIHMDGTAIFWDSIPRQYLRNTLSVVTSRGCHYRCRFCTYHHWFPKVQYKSLEVLKDELRRIQNLGFVRHVRFSDDNFTAKRSRLKAVLEMMIQERFDFTWSSYARANALTPDLVRLMKASGCDLLVMGIESGSPAILKNMDKRLDPGQALDALRMLKNHDIDSQAAFIVGYPGETEKTFHETIDFINQSGLKYFHPYLFYFSKNMLVDRERETFNLNGLGLAWKHHTMDSVEASYLMSQMIRLIDQGFTDGQQNTWETYKLLRGEGYSREEIHRLHKLKRRLQLTVQAADRERLNHTANILKDLESIIK